jgi:hypothetical protein
MALETNNRHHRSAAPKLSVVLVGFNMARELPRTIRSLSPDMQRGIDPCDYEVILIDNGSTQEIDAKKIGGLATSCRLDLQQLSMFD